jgi:hypothetical protein
MLNNDPEFRFLIIKKRNAGFILMIISIKSKIKFYLEILNKKNKIKPLFRVIKILLLTAIIIKTGMVGILFFD